MPYPASRWSAEVGAAAEAYLLMQLDRAGALLDELNLQAPCLDEPIAPTLLGAYARLEALRWMYAQDPDGLTAWAALAKEVDPDGVWIVDADHPIHRRVLALLPSTPYGPEGRYVAHPRRGGVFLDGHFLEVPQALSGSPHLVQRFDADGLRLGGWWQDGGAFRDELLSLVPIDATLPRWWGGAPEDVAPNGFGPARKDTIAGYERYLRADPTGAHVAWVRRRLDDLTWERAHDEGTVDAARAYLAAWPTGRNRAEANLVVETADFAAAVADGRSSAFELFRSRYPRGAYAAEANRRLDALAFAAASTEHTPAGYARYRVRFPRGAHLREARLAQEELEWTAALEIGSSAVYTAFLNAWPTGNHAPDARALLAGVRFSRVAVAVSAGGIDDPGVVVTALLKAARLVGLPGSALERAAAAPQVDDDTGLLWLTVVPGPDGSGVLTATLQLRVAALSQALATITVSAGPSADATAAERLAIYLVDELPPLARWTRPLP